MIPKTSGRLRTQPRNQLLAHHMLQAIGQMLDRVFANELARQLEQEFPGNNEHTMTGQADKFVSFMFKRSSEFKEELKAQLSTLGKPLRETLSP